MRLCSGRQTSQVSRVATCLIDGHDPLPNFVLADAKPHDPNKLPHMYDDETIDEMFPRIEAPAQNMNDDDWIQGDCFWKEQDGSPP